LSSKCIVVVPPSNYRATPGWEEVSWAPSEGATIAATVLKDAGHSVVGYDLRNPSDRLVFGNQGLPREEISKYNIISIAGAPDSFVHVREISRLVKMGNPEVQVLLGGPLATHSFRVVLDKTDVDYCILGECEETLPQLVECIESAKPAAGLAVASRNLPEPPTPRPVDMNSVPLPDYGVWVNRPDRDGPRVVCYSTQRGCSSDCEFCAKHRSWQPRVIGLVESDLRQLSAGGTRELWLSDPTFNANRAHCQSVIALLDRLGLTWSCTMRVDLVDGDLLRTMKQSGCKGVFVGLESASSDVLAASRKGTTSQMNGRFLELAEEVCLPVVGFLLLGLKGETLETLEQTLEMTRRHTFIPRPRYPVPYPGTRLARPSGLSEEDLLVIMSRASPDIANMPISPPRDKLLLQRMAEVKRELCDIAAERTARVFPAVSPEQQREITPGAKETN
jgi:radical SAM superfamily enzyme YgiQ (UPF0313 family)